MVPWINSISGNVWLLQFCLSNQCYLARSAMHWFPTRELSWRTASGLWLSSTTTRFFMSCKPHVHTFSSSSWCEYGWSPFRSVVQRMQSEKYPEEWPSAVHTFEELRRTLQREIISHCDLNGSRSRRSSPASPTAYHSWTPWDSSWMQVRGILQTWRMAKSMAIAGT